MTGGGACKTAHLAQKWVTRLLRNCEHNSNYPLVAPDAQTLLVDNKYPLKEQFVNHNNCAGAVICFIIYFVMGFFGAARWGLATDGNLLVNEWGPAHYQGILNILLGGEETILLRLQYFLPVRADMASMFPQSHLRYDSCTCTFPFCVQGMEGYSNACCHAGCSALTRL